MTSESTSHNDASLGHVVPLPVLLGVFTGLMVLTAVTVGVSYFDLGPINLAVAMAVATVKATLVALYFMHLRYDNLFNATIFLIGVAFLGLFLGITMLDTIECYPDVQSREETLREMP